MGHDEEQVGEGGGEEGPPQPDLAAHVAQAFADLVPQARLPRPRRPPRPPRPRRPPRRAGLPVPGDGHHPPYARRRKREAGGVQGKRPGRCSRATATPPRAGPASWRAEGRTNCRWRSPGSARLRGRAGAPGHRRRARRRRWPSQSGAGGAELVEPGRPRATMAQGRAARRARGQPRTAPSAGRNGPNGAAHEQQGHLGGEVARPT